MKRPFHQPLRHSRNAAKQMREHAHAQFKERQQAAVQRGGYLMLQRQQELERFSQARARALQLQAIVPNGRLTKGQLAELQVKDNAGVIWMAGLDEQSWFRWDGDDWIPGTPASLLPSRNDDIGLYIFFMLPILIFIGWVLYRLFGGG